jgi:predicted metal-dependent HD superfamily phosphohydrolase
MTGVTLIDRWRAACRRTGARGDLDGAGHDLLRRWSQPHRHYHDVRHLAAVLDVVDTHEAAAAHPNRVRLAAWFHDAVYDPRAAGDANERASADLAEATLTTLGAPADVAAGVARLVRVTAGHDPGPDDPDGLLLCDADLAVLARSPDDYDAYARAVRLEYAHVPGPAFRTGRAQVLRRLLALPALYRLPALEPWEAPARANLTRELASLSGGAGGGGGADPPR